MINDLWINIPVENIVAAKAYYEAIGFSSNSHYPDSQDMASLKIGSTIVMLVQRKMFQSFTQHNIADTMAGTEVLFSIGVENPDEIDEIAQKVMLAGGHVFAAPAHSNGWMYGCGFTDLDGHRWNALYMDMSKIPARSCHQ